MQRHTGVHVSGGLDQNEDDPARRSGGVAPQVAGAALHDDAPCPDCFHGAIIKFQLDFARENDAVINAVRAMKWRGRARQHIHNADHRAVIDGESHITLAAEVKPIQQIGESDIIATS